VREIAEQRARAIGRIRGLVSFFIFGLVISGATALPLQSEIKFLSGWFHDSPFLGPWLQRIHEGLDETSAHYPFMAYGTDWLAFAHFVIALVFIGPLRDPVRNIWVIEFGMLACILVVPFALVVGGIREIPIGWRLIDCSFGVFGILPLWYCHREIRRLATLDTASAIPLTPPRH
jgi:hypothetical protein